MTHEELRARIELVDVIRAVIRLHQPMEQSETEICEECTRISSIRIKYPCRTIETIRKELK